MGEREIREGERELEREREIVGSRRGSGRGRGREIGGMGVCVIDVESTGWERREWEDKSVCVYERERVGDGRECESRGWQRESKMMGERK